MVLLWAGRLVNPSVCLPIQVLLSHFSAAPIKISKIHDARDPRSLRDNFLTSLTYHLHSAQKVDPFLYSFSHNRTFSTPHYNETKS